MFTSTTKRDTCSSVPFITISRQNDYHHTTTTTTTNNNNFPMAQQPPVGQGLLVIEASRSHSDTHHTRYDSSGRVISPTHRLLPDNTQHSGERETSMSPAGFEHTIAASERPQTHALDRAATGIGCC
jgi:hypothetical protein